MEIEVILFCKENCLWETYNSISKCVIWNVEFVKTFNELEVYKLSRELSLSLFEMSKSFPKEEKFSLTDQVRRSSRSIGAQIVEAWAKRMYEKHFVSKLTDSVGEQLETQHWIEIAEDCKYLSKENAGELLTKCCSIGRMLNAMINKSHNFCKNSNL